MKKDVKIKGQLKLYLEWPAIMALVLIGMNGWIFTIDKKAGIVMGIFVLIYIVAVAVMYLYSKSMVLTELVDFATQYGFLQNVLLKDLSIPYAIMMDDGKILWSNDKFQQVLGEVNLADKYLSNFIHELNRSIFPKEVGQKIGVEILYQERIYKVVLSKLSVEDFTDADKMVSFPKDREYVVTVTMEDVTDLHHFMEECEGQKLVTGLIYIDNYEEDMERIIDSNQAIMEIKATGAMPLWIVKLLSEHKIYRQSFSKYGRQYQKECQNKRSVVL